MEYHSRGLWEKLVEAMIPSFSTTVYFGRSFTVGFMGEAVGILPLWHSFM